MTSSNGNIFRVTGPLCGEFTGHRWIPLTKGQWRGALMFSLICALNKRLSKQSWTWWFETPSRLSWRHCNVISLWVWVASYVIRMKYHIELYKSWLPQIWYVIQMTRVVSYVIWMRCYLGLNHPDDLLKWRYVISVIYSDMIQYPDDKLHQT